MQSRGKLSASDGVSSTYSAKNSIQPYGGIGAAYHVTPMFSITAKGNVSRVKYGVDGEYDTAAVQLWSVGVSVQF